MAAMSNYPAPWAPLIEDAVNLSQLVPWAFVSGEVGLRKPSPEAKKIRALEKELNRKEKALAEVAALLALEKKAEEIWGDGDDDTTT